MPFLQLPLRGLGVRVVVDAARRSALGHAAKWGGGG
jgi:hypothetical protein